MEQKKLKNQTISEIIEIGIYKDFPLSHLILLIPAGILMCIIFMGAEWLFESKPFSIKHAVIGGTILMIVWYIPGFISALAMKLIRKPMLRFNTAGFYYTPQLWTKNKLCLWRNVTKITVLHFIDSPDERDEDDIEETHVVISLADKTRITIRDKLLPISWDSLLQAFQRFLPNTPIDTCFRIIEGSD